MESTGHKLEAGTVLGERYKLLSPIGDGAMGEVWSAEHLTLGHTLAIKALRTTMKDEESIARFEREARVMAQLGDLSRHITRVTEHGVMPDGTPYLVMEVLRGEGLDLLLKRERRLSLDRVAAIITQLCKALSAAHKEGVVHRDIKPANIFITQNEDNELLVKLLDFGVAKAMAEAANDTGAGQLVGTPNYMSPEQMSADATVDHRSDLFAVGSIAYRCATGKTPFGNGSVKEMATRILTAEPPVPSKVHSGLPKSFDAFIAKALAKEPADRFQSARELSDALREVAEVPPEVRVGVEMSGSRILPIDPSDIPPELSTLSTKHALSTEAPRSVARPASNGSQTLGAVLLAIAGFGVFLIYLRSPGGEWLRVKLGLQGPSAPVIAAPLNPAPSASGAAGSPTH
jgi:eukaryotic-like serine/threonine-protein kinase